MAALYILFCRCVDVLSLCCRVAGSSERLPLRTAHQQTGEPAAGHQGGDEDRDPHGAGPDEQQDGPAGPQEQTPGNTPAHTPQQC